MSASTKLSTSVKALCFLAQTPERGHSSAEIATAIGVNASKLRKLLSMMGRGGIVTSVMGAAGGFMLRRPPAEIDLQEIYCAIEDRKAFHLNVHQMGETMPAISSKINRYFLDLFDEIQYDIENKMRKISLQSIIDNINKS